MYTPSEILALLTTWTKTHPKLILEAAQTLSDVRTWKAAWSERHDVEMAAHREEVLARLRQEQAELARQMTQETAPVSKPALIEWLEKTSREPAPVETVEQPTKPAPRKRTVKVALATTPAKKSAKLAASKSATKSVTNGRATGSARSRTPKKAAASAHS
jgi:hypothetical protein